MSARLIRFEHGRRRGRIRTHQSRRRPQEHIRRPFTQIQVTDPTRSDDDVCVAVPVHVACARDASSEIGSTKAKNVTPYTIRFEHRRRRHGVSTHDPGGRPQKEEGRPFICLPIVE